MMHAGRNPSNQRLNNPWRRCTSGCVLPLRSPILFSPHSKKCVRENEGNRLISSIVNTSGFSTSP